jgi:hypothetical protein
VITKGEFYMEFHAPSPTTPPRSYYLVGQLVFLCVLKSSEAPLNAQPTNHSKDSNCLLMMGGIMIGSESGNFALSLSLLKSDRNAYQNGE